MKIKEIKNGNINKVYILKNSHNSFIIRTSNFTNTFECKVLKLLNDYHFASPHFITNFIANDNNIVIYDYIDGKNPKKINNIFLINLATTLKKLHLINCDFEQIEYDYNEENEKKLKEYYKDTLKSKFLSNDREFINYLYNDVQNINFDNLNKCLIHSDIKRENVVVQDNRIFLIDFGNAYIGSRLIDIIRVIMWFFIKDKNYNYEKIYIFINTYFTNNNITNEEKDIFSKLLKYCLLYNLLKDISLYNKGILEKKYIKKNTLKWLEALKDENRLLKIEEMIKNA